MPWICPSTKRHQRLYELALSYEKALCLTPVICILDESDAETYAKLIWPESWSFSYTKTKGPNAILNEYFEAHPNEKFYGVIADDCIIRTPGALEELEAQARTYFIAYGDDKAWGSQIPTHPCIGGDLLRSLGWWAHPEFSHNCADKVWLAFGLQHGLLRYEPEVVIEHMHPAFNKAPWDEQYLQNYNPEKTDRESRTERANDDEDYYHEYLQTNFLEDCKRVRAMLAHRQAKNLL